MVVLGDSTLDCAKSVQLHGEIATFATQTRNDNVVEIAASLKLLVGDIWLRLVPAVTIVHSYAFASARFFACGSE